MSKNTSKKSTVKPLTFWQSIMLGCDPEFFFASKDGKAIGSEKVLPKNGLKVDNYDSNIVIDGVQAELNPIPSTCREQVAWQIYACFNKLKSSLTGDVKVVASSVVDIDQKELDSLSEGSRVFGCAPSTNVYYEGKDKTSKIVVDPKKYLKRSAGGHIHLGNYYSAYSNNPAYSNTDFNSHYQIGIRTENALKHMPDVMVRMLDTIVGNTAVLIDRDPANAERRKNYGRAGEYRIKPYGLEYRTLSNFWLRSYPLFSMMFGLARFAVHLVEQSTPENDYVKAIFNAVSKEDVVKAINKNNFDLAYSNFKKIEEIILAAAYEGDRPERYYPLKKSTIKLFHHFVRRINEKGLEYWFKDDAYTHWTSTYTLPDGRLCYAYNQKGGWEVWLKNTVAKDMSDQQKIDLNKKKKEVAKKDLVLTR